MTAAKINSKLRKLFRMKGVHLRPSFFFVHETPSSWVNDSYVGKRVYIVALTISSSIFRCVFLLRLHKGDLITRLNSNDFKTNMKATGYQVARPNINGNSFDALTLCQKMKPSLIKFSHNSSLQTSLFRA
jgi:hypothetical protein